MCDLFWQHGKLSVTKMFSTFIVTFTSNIKAKNYTLDALHCIYNIQNSKNTIFFDWFIWIISNKWMEIIHFMVHKFRRIGHESEYTVYHSMNVIQCVIQNEEGSFHHKFNSNTTIWCWIKLYFHCIGEYYYRYSFKIICFWLTLKQLSITQLVV